MSDVLIKGMKMPRNCLDCPLQGGFDLCYGAAYMDELKRIRIKKEAEDGAAEV